MKNMDQRFLKEYRCKNCNKLLCKGSLSGSETFLEVKCRGCGLICVFHGEDAEIVINRSVLIKQGLIPDTDLE